MSESERMRIYRLTVYARGLERKLERLAKRVAALELEQARRVMERVHTVKGVTAHPRKMGG